MEEGQGMVLVTCRQDLEKQLAAGGAVLALFYTSWCPFCTPILPLFREAASRRGFRALLVQDDGEEMAEAYAVQVYPTLLYWEGSRAVKRLDGMLGSGLSAAAVTAFLDHLAPHPQ